MEHTDTLKRKPASFTIREDILSEAKELGLNVSRAAEEGISAAVKTAREECWLKENKGAIQATNKRISKQGTLLKPLWAE